MPTQLELEADAKKWKRILDNMVRVLVILMAIAVGASLYLTTVSVSQLKEQGSEVKNLSESNKKLNEASLNNSKILVDCTTPGHACYERSRGETGKVVLSLNQVTQAAVVCADQPGAITFAQMDTCIKTELAKIK